MVGQQWRRGGELGFEWRAQARPRGKGWPLLPARCEARVVLTGRAAGSALSQIIAKTQMVPAFGPTRRSGRDRLRGAVDAPHVTRGQLGSQGGGRAAGAGRGADEAWQPGRVAPRVPG